MLQPSMLDKLNDQVALEHFSSSLYLSMASWCHAQGLEGSAAFLEAHSAEELSHMKKLFTYINETGAQAIIAAMEKPQSTFKDLKEVFELTYAHEMMITRKINELVDTALSIKDYSTFNFLQWYVSEQHEEEALFGRILNKMSIIGLEGRGLHLVDKEIGALIARS